MVLKNGTSVKISQVIALNGQLLGSMRQMIIERKRINFFKIIELQYKIGASVVLNLGR